MPKPPKLWSPSPEDAQAAIARAVEVELPELLRRVVKALAAFDSSARLLSPVEQDFVAAFNNSRVHAGWRAVDTAVLDAMTWIRTVHESGAACRPMLDNPLPPVFQAQGIAVPAGHVVRLSPTLDDAIDSIPARMRNLYDLLAAVRTWPWPIETAEGRNSMLKPQWTVVDSEGTWQDAGHALGSPRREDVAAFFPTLTKPGAPEYAVVVRGVALERLGAIERTLRRDWLGESVGGDSGDSDYRPATWFRKGMAARLRKAASKNRPTKRVATRMIDGVVCYCVADARRWWPSDVPTNQ